MSFSARAAAFVKFWLFSLVTALALLGPGVASADGFRPFSRIVVFGDSLSDSGNLYALTRGAHVAAPAYGMDGFDRNGIPEVVALIPELAYETERLSNGRTWVELLGLSLGLGANVKPAFATPPDPRAFNFAVAGAPAAPLDSVNPFHLTVQVNAYLGRLAGAKSPPDALHVIAIGGNDVRAVFTHGPGVLANALGSIQTNVTNLYRVAGAKKFVIWNIPDVGRTPAFQRLQNGVAPFFPGIPGIANTATALVGGAPGVPGYNPALKALISHLSTAPESAGGLPGIEIVYFDAFTILGDVQSHPRRYGLLDAATACIQPYVPPFAFGVDPYHCSRPDRQLFWDGIHPTRAGHALTALLVARELLKAAVHD